jgi:prepilin peptidase CpaA
MDSPIVVLLAVVLISVIYTDLRSSRIPNVLTFAGMAIGSIAQAWLAGSQGLLFSLEGLGVGLGIFLFLYASGGVGAGDVKLMGAVGAMVGPYGALVSGLMAFLIGGVYALGAMCYQWGIADTARKLVSATQGAVLLRGHSWTHELRLPFHLRYGLAIAGGTLLFMLGLHPFGE